VRGPAGWQAGDVPGDHGRRAVLPLLTVSGVVVLVVSGLARGVWLANLHNGVLALALSLVGAYVLAQRPGHPVGRLFLSAGAVEAVLFLGRQLGRTAGGGAWWGWLGVWPVAVGLALTTLAVLVFPDGRLPAPGWRPVLIPALGLAGAATLLSALWPVEYGSTGVATAHPLHLGGGAAAGAVWDALAHPLYAGLQLLWVPAVVVRWRRSGRLVRVQLAWVGLAAGVSAVALVAGLAVAGSPRAGLLTAGLVPLAAGWAIVHGQQLAAYSALSWLPGSRDLTADLAAAAAEALGAPRATVWVGPAGALRAGAATADLAGLAADPALTVRPVTRDGAVVGALAVERPAADRLSVTEERVLAGLAAQAALVLQARPPAPPDLSGLSPRERQVLELMARGLSNAAICAELHLSIKTVEPVVSSIFTKLDLDPAANRRVLAVVAYLRAD
jgi:DNA-binding CsgD family transcriptional regulator